MKTVRLLILGVLVLGLVSGQVFAGTEDTNNTFYGLGAGANNTQTTAGATFIGYNAGHDNTSGGSNSFLGWGAGRYNTTGAWNLFIGDSAGMSNITGNYSTIVGTSAGMHNTASNNTFMGYQAGHYNTTGSYNIFFGNESGYINTTGGSNTFIGYQVGYNSNASNNTLIGYQAGFSNTTGGPNTFLGQWAGYSNTTGGHNTFLGNSAGYHNVDGVGNVFLGYEAGGNAVGSNALYIANSNTATPLIYGEFDYRKLTVNGDLNVVGPYGQLFLSNSTADNTTKNLRIKLNHYANAQMPVLVFKATSSATKNLVALGGSMSNATAATQIDFYTAADNITSTGTSRLTVKSNGYIGIGTQSPTNPLHMASGAYVTTGGVWTNASSREYKDRIQSLSAAEALAALKELNPVKYVYKADKTEKHVGFIAEDVPELLATKDRKGLSAMDIVAVLTKALQEQQKIVQQQQGTVDEQQRTIIEQQKINQEYKMKFEEQQKINQELSIKMAAIEKQLKAKVHPTGVSLLEE